MAKGKEVLKQRTRMRGTTETCAVSSSKGTAKERELLTEEITKERIHVVFESPPAYVRVEGSVTQNMGDYNSIRVGVVVERPCQNTDDDIQKTYEQVSAKVDELVQRELDMAMGGRPDGA